VFYGIKKLPLGVWKKDGGIARMYSLEERCGKYKDVFGIF
jgi:hypothetical protein